MNEREKITVVANDGQERQGEIIMDVTLESTGKNYILYIFSIIIKYIIITNKLWYKIWN